MLGFDMGMAVTMQGHLGMALYETGHTHDAGTTTFLFAALSFFLDSPPPSATCSSEALRGEEA